MSDIVREVPELPVPKSGARKRCAFLLSLTLLGLLLLLWRPVQV